MKSQNSRIKQLLFTPLFRVVAIYAIALWFSLGLVGYGLAIENTSKAEPIYWGGVNVREGKVGWSSIGWPRSRGGKFKFQGNDEVIEIDPSLIPETGDAWKQIDQGVKNGTQIWTKVYAAFGRTILFELIVNRFTPFEKQVLFMSQTAQLWDEKPKHARAMGQVYLLWGLGLVPLILIVHLIFKQFVLPKFSKSSSAIST